MKRLVNYFLKGLLFLVPIAVTVYVFIAAFQKIDGWLPLPVPGVGVALLVVAVTLVGVLVSTIFAGGLARWADSFFGRLPLAKLLYSAVKDLLSAFVGETKRFQRPVSVELEPNGVRVFGFLTRESLEDFGLPEFAAVFIPQAYNFAGHLLLVRRSQVHPVTAPSANLMAFIVSGGVSARSMDKPAP